MTVPCSSVTGTYTSMWNLLNPLALEKAQPVAVGHRAVLARQPGDLGEPHRDASDA